MPTTIDDKQHNGGIQKNQSGIRSKKIFDIFGDMRYTDIVKRKLYEREGLG